jgi:outer membrane protein
MNARDMIARPGNRGVMLGTFCLFCFLMAVPPLLYAQEPVPEGINAVTGPTSTMPGPPATGGNLSSQLTATASKPPTAGADQADVQPPPLKEPAPGVIQEAIQQPPTSPILPPGPDLRGAAYITAGQVLNMHQCIDIALGQNTAIMAAGGIVQISRSRLGEARSDYYPQLSAAAGYTRTAAPDTVVNLPANRYDSYTGSVQLYQNIVNPRTWSAVKAAKQTLEASREDQVATENNVVLSVKTAYYQVLQAKRDRDVAADVISGYQLHLDQAKGFYDVGTKAKVDVIKAEVDLSNAKLALIKAENSYKVSWLNLNTVMGVPDAPQYTIEDNLSYQPYPLTLDEATARAFDNRPDLKSAVARREAAESGISVAQAGHYPVLSGNASYVKGGIGLSPSELNDGWSAGVTLNIPLFSGFLVSHQVAEAKGNLYVLKANEEDTRQQILLQVRQAYLALRAAEASISTAELAARQAKENLDLQNGRYAAGVGSPLDVSDAFNTYVQNQSQYISALAIYRVAQAALEQAMGMQ